MTSEAEISLLKKKRRKLEKRIDEQESFIRNFTQLLEEGEDNLARVQPYLALDEYDRKNYTFTGCGDFDGLHFNWQDVFQKMIDDGSMPDYQGMHDEDFTFRLYIDGYTRFSIRMPYFYSHEEFSQGLPLIRARLRGIRPEKTPAGTAQKGRKRAKEGAA